MLQTLERPSVRHSSKALPPVVGEIDVGDVGLEDASPFGLQGLQRETLRVLKADCITRLATTLALTATRKQIRDEGFVAEMLQHEHAGARRIGAAQLSRRNR